MPSDPVAMLNDETTQAQDKKTATRSDTPCSKLLTGFFLLPCQFMPVALHSIPQSHPQFGLFMRGHDFPSFLNVRQCRI